MDRRSDGRLLIVSNRLPMSVRRRDGEVHFIRSVGGLATGLSPVHRRLGGRWIGWPGLHSDILSPEDTAKIEARLKKEECDPVFLSHREMEDYYHGFANKTIWPLFHYFPSYTTYNDRFWNAYEGVNEKFCEVILDVAQPGDTIWIQDYHLLLLPRLIRQNMRDVSLGLFLHIPFPAFEMFRMMPWREEILEGMLGADLIGFHIYAYVRDFLDSTRRILGLEHALGQLNVSNRMVKVDAFPMGVDYDRFAKAFKNERVRRETEEIRRETEDRRIIISIDRLDYTKGILQRLEAFNDFLASSAEDVGRVTLILLVVPSRTQVSQYAMMKKRVDEMVGRINGRFGSIGWVPIWYLYRSLPFEKLVALYAAADVALVTPIRDGMNLVAKEYVATKNDVNGALILSEMAGAAEELSEALIVNPNNIQEVSASIKKALTMPWEERKERMAAMQARLKRYDISGWAEDFLDRLRQIKSLQRGVAVRRLTDEARRRLIEDCRRAEKRLFLFDYDGTLVPFAERPELARPDEELRSILEALAADKKNEVVIISNRDRYTLEEWFGDYRMSLSSEHGVWVKEFGRDWRLVEPVDSGWKAEIHSVLERYVDRTPGSFIEEKDFSLVWHYRTVDPELAAVRAWELKDTLLQLTASFDLEVADGNKIIMVKKAGVDKGRAAVRWAFREGWDFILCAGDDWTDEDMFAVLPEQAYSVRVGLKISRARFNLTSPQEFRVLLKDLIALEVSGPGPRRGDPAPERP